MSREFKVPEALRAISKISLSPPSDSGARLCGLFVFVLHRDRFVRRPNTMTSLKECSYYRTCSRCVRGCVKSTMECRRQPLSKQLQR